MSAEAIPTAASLTLQLVASAGLALLAIVIHSVGLIEVSRRLHLRREELRDREFDYSAILLMAGLGLILFTLHIVEILLFALFYLKIGAVEGVESAFHHSASAYATLGTGQDPFAESWRLVMSIEALTGFILIGWSTAFMVSTVNRLRG